MEEYVKKSDLNAVIRKLANEPAYYHEGESFYSGVCAIEGELMCLPTIKLKEPLVGKWISASQKPGVHAGMKCSLCKARISYSEFHNGQHIYCHKCGAKMTGGNNNA